MDIKITPTKLGGKLIVPPSKSISHRMLICAALCDGMTHIDNLLECMDSHATINALTALGAEIKGKNGSYDVKGIVNPKKTAVVDCFESGSTLRFMIPIFSAFGCEAEFTGRGKLPERPITPIIKPMIDNGATFETLTMPYKVKGKLHGGKYYIDGSVSSQFITGLLFALSVLKEDSEIILTTKLESRPYVNITIDCMKQFGVEVAETENGYFVKGGQKYQPHNCTVEADMSQSAFFIAANCAGSDIELANLNMNSVQGDKAIIDIADKFKNGGDLSIIDASDIPDLVPAIAVMMSFWKKPCRIINCERLRIKECDRLAATTELINDLGGNAVAYSDSIEIFPVEAFKGGTIRNYNDHRIAMAGAVAATRSTGDVIIKGAECTNKSYPGFFDDFRALGGIADVINV